MATLVRRRATYEDLLRLSLEPIAEIVDGNLYTSPRPSIPHAVLLSGLSAALGTAFQLGRGGPGGWWLLFEPELQLADDILVADLAGWRRQRLPRPPETVAIDLAPDWICEVVSPSTEGLDRQHKLPAYARHGVAHAWLIDPSLRRLEVLRHEGRRYALLNSFAGDGLIRAQPFEAVELELLSLWGSGSGFAEL